MPRRPATLPLLVAWAVVLSLVGSLSQAAIAEDLPPPAERALVYSAYETETIQGALTTLRRALEPNPEGKLVERVDVIPLDVIEPRDPVPRWVNVFHATSRRDIVLRELLVSEGTPYRQLLVDETLRNLRRLPQLSVVLVVATKGSRPDRVGVIIITKDVWSLRTNWNFVVTAGGLERLEAFPAETNFLGTHQTLSGHFVLEPSAYTLGLGYIVPRLGESRLALEARWDFFINRQSGSSEGSLASLVAGQPIYSALTQWAWDASVTAVDMVTRRYVNAALSRYVDRRTGESVPDEYRAREYIATYEVTRSFGVTAKHDFTLAARIDRRQYLAGSASPTRAKPQTIADYVAGNVPVSDTRVGPSLQYHTYSKRYIRLIDFDTLALQEDYRLGHDIVLRAYPSFRAIGSTRDFFGIYAAAEYTFAVRDGLFRASIESTVEAEPQRVSDAALLPALHLASPTVLGLGRVVLDATLLYRWRNYLNAITYLGGDDRVRGYPTNFFKGKDVVSLNMEFRTRPVEVLTCQLAGVAFFDAGDAFSGFDTFEAHQSVGFGLRTLFPQLDRVVARADVGFPLRRAIVPETHVPIAPFAVLVSFAQAFSTPSVSPKRILPTGQ
ncbi:MAG: hypothetical protein M3O36_05995 [Myxococcota bacterium]|nr:hypothetical protein [Myxococcota bacterium]